MMRLNQTWPLKRLKGSSTYNRLYRNVVLMVYRQILDFPEPQRQLTANQLIQITKFRFFVSAFYLKLS